jgi:hypothetical protein
MKDRKPFILPPHANIPKEWIVEENGFELKIVFPSWSRQGGAYRLTLHKFTREMSCECEGFRFRGVCHHIRGLKWATTRPLKSKKPGIADTSIESIRMFSEEDLGDRQAEVFRKLQKNGPLSIRELSEALNWPSHCITGRLMEVRKMGAVDYVGDKYDNVTNRRVSLWGVV